MIAVRLLPALAVLAFAVPCRAVDASPEVPQRGGEPHVQHRVAEDDQVRVEELVVRGEVKSVVVQPKLVKAPAYEVVTGGGARDDAHKGASGQRVWHLLGF
jgi:hypothetical protein